MCDRPHACVPKYLPRDLAALAREVAMQENPANASVFSSSRVLRAAMQTRKRWANGRRITVSFMGGSRVVRDRVQPYFHEWSKYANIKFSFLTGSGGDIRVGFDQNDGSWSYLGPDALLVPPNEATMNYGWLVDSSAEEEYRRVVLHEVGHALGLEHELQQPSSDIEWDLDAVIAYYTGAPNFWSREDVFHNVIDRISATGVEHTRFDDKSIMAYSVPKRFDKKGRGVPFNTHLSPIDILFIGNMYPFENPTIIPPVPLPLLKHDSWLEDHLNDVDPINEYAAKVDSIGVYRFWTSYVGAPVSIVHPSDPNNPVGRGLQQMSVRLVPANYNFRVQLAGPGKGAAYRLKYRKVA